MLVDKWHLLDYYIFSNLLTYLFPFVNILLNPCCIKVYEVFIDEIFHKKSPAFPPLKKEVYYVDITENK